MLPVHMKSVAFFFHLVMARTTVKAKLLAQQHYLSTWPKEAHRTPNLGAGLTEAIGRPGYDRQRLSLCRAGATSQVRFETQKDTQSKCKSRPRHTPHSSELPRLRPPPAEARCSRNSQFQSACSLGISLASCTG